MERLYNSIVDRFLINEPTENDQFSHEECQQILLTAPQGEFRFVLEHVERTPEGKRLVDEYQQFAERAGQIGAAFFADYVPTRDVMQRFMSQLEAWRSGDAQTVINGFDDEERAAFIGFSVERPDIADIMAPCIGEVVASLMHNDECAPGVLRLALRTSVWNAAISRSAGLIVQSIRTAERDLGIGVIEPYLLQDLRKRAGANAIVREESAPKILPNGSYDHIKRFPNADEGLQATARALADGLLEKVGRFQSANYASTAETVRETFMGLRKPSPQTLEWLERINVATKRPGTPTASIPAITHGCGSK